MSIQVLTDSHMPHLTPSTVSVSTKYVMDINDFFNGYGVVTLCDGTVVNTRFLLPSIGMKYIQYYYLPQLLGYWQDVVLGDITTEKTNARSLELIDTTGWDLDKKIIVTYTWSNTAKKDIITANDQSSVRFNIETNTQVELTDLIIATDGTVTSAAHTFFTLKNPDIILYVSDTESDDRGPYTAPLDSEGGTAGADEKASLQRHHRDNNESPAHEKHTTQTILTVTAYSKNNYFFLLSDNINKINSVDFISNPYSEREQRLQSKDRFPTYEFTDIASQDDTEKWLFYDYTKVESGIDLYKYDFFFLYKTDAWTSWYGSDVDEYVKIDFNATLLTPMFNTGI